MIYGQIKMDSDTFNISHIIKVYLLYFRKCNKMWQELRVELCQNKVILIMSDNFDRKVCNGLQSTKKLDNC